jgi:hypothetical protein
MLAFREESERERQALEMTANELHRASEDVSRQFVMVRSIVIRVRNSIDHFYLLATTKRN